MPRPTVWDTLAIDVSAGQVFRGTYGRVLYTPNTCIAVNKVMTEVDASFKKYGLGGMPPHVSIVTPISLLLQSFKENGLGCVPPLVSLVTPHSLPFQSFKKNGLGGVPPLVSSQTSLTSITVI